MVADEQTQRLPSDAEELDALRAVLRLCRSRRFRKALTAHVRRVEEHYARLFEEAPELATGGGQPRLHRHDRRSRNARDAARAGLPPARDRRPRPCAAGISAAGRRSPARRAREVLTELVPRAARALSRGSGDPDAALAAFDKALGRMPAAVELFSILQSHKPRSARCFADMLGTRAAPRRDRGAAARMCSTR